MDMPVYTLVGKLCIRQPSEACPCAVLGRCGQAMQSSHADTCCAVCICRVVLVVSSTASIRQAAPGSATESYHVSLHMPC